jgi:hypothetical protein
MRLKLMTKKASDARKNVCVIIKQVEISRLVTEIAPF